MMNGKKHRNKGDKMLLQHSGTPIEDVRKIIEKKNIRIYMIGICGASMSSLARELKRRGAAVFGSDISSPAVRAALISEGIYVSSVHSERAMVSFEPDLVVYSLAVTGDNVEYRYAIDNGILAISRAELLGALVSTYGESVGVCGSHGKSTVTSMIYHILSRVGQAPALFEGAPIKEKQEALCDTVVFEACEYRDSFLRMKSSLGVILNIELDHTDYFKDLDAIRCSFRSYAEGCSRVLINVDDDAAGNMIFGLSATVLTYGKSPLADYRFEIISENRGKFSFRLHYKGDSTGEISLDVPGEFNVSNAAAAIAAAHLLGVSLVDAGEAIATYKGIGRRLERLSCTLLPVYYDYAHHPTEMRAVLEALSRMGYSKIGVIFSPHTYSRTQALWSDFVEVLSLPHATVITDVYAAREEKIDGVDSQTLANACRAGGANAVSLNGEKAFSWLLSHEVDVAVLMGAGNLDAVLSAVQKER